MSEQEWSEWFEHDGKGCPVKGQYVRVRFKEYGVNENGVWAIECEGIATGNPEAWAWDHNSGEFNKVLRYRIRKPKGFTILEQIVQDVPEKVTA